MTPEIVTLKPSLVPPIAIRPGAIAPPSAPADGAGMADAAPADRAAMPALILFGRDERGRPHASRFSAAEAEAAIRAAALMDLYTLTVAEAHHPLAAGLPQGRLFGSGRAFVPFCSTAMFAKLLAAAGLPDTPVPVRAAGKAAEAPPAGKGASGSGGSPDSPGGAPMAPRDWAAIGIGSIVLACQGPMEGWWEAVVLLTKADDAFVLRWRDYPADGEFTRARKDLGLLPPDSREGMA